MSNNSTEKSLSQCGKAALWYAERMNWPVHPLNGKIPIIPDWPNRASTNYKTISSWWTENPSANVGILCGRRSGIIVIDIDPRNGGEESFDGLVEELGPLPPTPEVMTGGGGRHIYFRYPENRSIPKAKPRAGIDIQSDGSQVVAPPSRHPQTGRPYIWEESSRPDQIPLADLPQRWISFLSEKQEGHRSVTSPSIWREFIRNGVTEGGRNDAVARLAGHLISKKIDPYVVLELVKAWNQSRNKPPLHDDEVVRTVNSIAGAELRKRGGGHVA